MILSVVTVGAADDFLRGAEHLGDLPARERHATSAARLALQEQRRAGVPEDVRSDIIPEQRHVAGAVPAPAQLAGNLLAVPVIYRLDLSDPNGFFMAQQFPITNRDVIYVSNAPFTDVQKVMTVASSVANYAAQGVVIAGK